MLPDDNVISVRLRIRGSPRRAVLLMLRKLESQCTGGANESEEVKVKGGKRGGRINGVSNFARDVSAGVHVHDYRGTGERE